MSQQRKPHKFSIRGIYETEDDPRFTEVTTFETAAQCQEWMSKVRGCTNPDYPSCDQIYTTLVDWNQVQTYLLDKIEYYRKKYPVSAPVPLSESNVFREEPKIMSMLSERLDLPIHQEMDETSTLNTLRYLFFHMKMGIFVMIRQNRLVMFVPFVNKDYTNLWGNDLEVSSSKRKLKSTESLREYISRKREMLLDIGKGGRPENYIMDKTRWWANGNIMCNVEAPNYWGDSYLPQLRDMLQKLCALRRVSDCEFFINKRDFPQLKRNVTEPYDFLYPTDDTPLLREKYSTYAPICSFFCGSAFADVPLVTTDDWETATGRVFPPNGVDIRSLHNRQKFAQLVSAWEDRVPTAIFRGNSTGAGVDDRANQRIHLARLSQTWRMEARTGKGSTNSTENEVPLLDAGLVGWNLRDRKVQNEPMSFIDVPALGVGLVDRVPMFQQMKYKYNIYVEGHCAAMRYASMMPLGSVILFVEAVSKADTMWYFPLLRPYDIHSDSPDPQGDHIRVKKDLSDLREVIEWCRAHDEQCRQIAENSVRLYDRLVAMEGQLDYMQLMVHEIAVRFRPAAGRAAQADEVLERALEEAKRAHLKIDAMTVAKKAGKSPALVAPEIINKNKGEDWFGPANAEYSACCIRFEASTAPISNEKSDCSCKACMLKLELKKIREKEARDRERTRVELENQEAQKKRASLGQTPNGNVQAHTDTVIPIIRKSAVEIKVGNMNKLKEAMLKRQQAAELARAADDKDEPPLKKSKSDFI